MDAGTHRGAVRDAEHLLRAPEDIRLEVLESLLLAHRITCDGIACTTCAILDCPAYEREHYDVDLGCPTCGPTTY